VDENNKVIGSNWLDVRDEVATLGPLSVSPRTQTKSVGTRLVATLVDMAKHENFEHVWLIQESCNYTSFSLYIKVGFDVKEQVTVFEGLIRTPYSGPIQVRKTTEKDIEECSELHKKVVGVSRHTAISRSAFAQRPYESYVAVSESGEILAVGGVCTTSFIVAKNEEAIHALHSSLSKLFPDEVPIIKVLGRLYPHLERRCLEWGLKVQRNFTCMAWNGGKYVSPNPKEGIYLPSLTY